MPLALHPLRHSLAWTSLLGLAAAFVGAADAAAKSECTNPARALGVSRVVEVDTGEGPQFGHQQYKDIDLLAPGEIVLTFDDGPLRPYTQPIVDALETQCTKATFFLVGSQALADPVMVRQIQRKGHTVGTHTWSHANLRKSTPLKARQEIELGFSAVAAAAGQPIAPFFRFPYLADTKAMLGYSQTRQMGIFSIEIDSNDYRTKNAAAVHRDVINQLADMGKGIILFHDIQPATAQALPGLLEALRSKGYRVVHLKPKMMATTLPDFDAVARDSNARKRMASAAQPLVTRSLTWGAAAPGVAARLPQAAPAVPGGPVLPPFGQIGPPPAGLATQSPPIPAPVPGDAAPAPFPRIARQRPPAEPDWRDKVFNR